MLANIGRHWENVGPMLRAGWVVTSQQELVGLSECFFRNKSAKIMIFDNSVLAATVAATAIIFVIFWIKRNGTKDAGRRFPPSAPVLPLIGALYRGGMSVLPEVFMKSAEKLGPVFSYKVGSRLIIILNGKEAISAAFLRQSEAFADRHEHWTEANVVNPKRRGIGLARYDETLKKYHKLCLSILKEFGFGVSSVSETRILREVELLKELILKYTGRPFNPKILTTHMTSSVVSSILFGETFMRSDICSRISESVNGFVACIELAIDFFPILRFLPTFQRKLFLLRQFHKDMINGIEEGIKSSKSPECESTFVRRFIDLEGEDYDHQDLVFIIRDLCMGSSESVSTMLQWAMVELANHPAIQNSLQQEIDDVLPNDKIPSLDDKPYLPYTEAVILEVSRRHTLAPLYAPHATLKDADVLGCYIPRGCMIIANAVSAHMDPKVWNDPEVFRPERFLDEDHKIIGSENVIAFGMGKRSCLGEILGRQTVFLFLVSLVQRFDIRPPEGQDSIRVKEVMTTIMHPSEFEVRLTPRTRIMS